MGTSKFVETVWFFVVLVGGSIVGYINIPPGAVIVNTVPSVVVCRTIIGCAVHNVTRDILATAEGGEEIGKIIANAFSGVQCLANIKVLDDGVVVIVIFEVMNDPTVDCLYLFGIGITACTNFVNKFFCLGVPQGCSTVVKIWGFRFADENICKDHRDQNKAGYY